MTRSLALLTISIAAVGHAAPPPLTIDGTINERFWQAVPSHPLGPGAGGEIRTVVAGNYLYIAARMPEAGGKITARSIGQNPAWEEEDALRITAGAGIGYTDRVLQVNPLGAYSLEKARHVVRKSESTYPYSDTQDADVVYQNIDRFLVASKVDDQGWTVEAAFPLSELSAPGPGSIFVKAERTRAQRQGMPGQTWYWPVLGPAARVAVMPGIEWNSGPPSFQPPLIGNKEPPLEVARVAELPPLNTAWDSGMWRGVRTWRLLRDEPLPRTPRFATDVKVLHNDRVLSIFARCSEPDTIKAAVNENDGPVERDDSFLVYLATSGSTYVQIAANALGYLKDDTGFSGGPRISRPREWDSGTRVDVQRQPGAWTVRLDIPLETASQVLGDVRIPKQWRILLMRVRAGRSGEPREASVLPVIQSETSLCTSRYRRLSLTSRAAEHVAALPPPAASAFDWQVLTAAERDKLRITGQVDRNIRERVRAFLEAERRDRDAIDSRAAWEKFRDVRMNAMRQSFGEFPARDPLETRISKEYSGTGYKRQDLVYKTRPGMWVTANLYLPLAPAAKMPGM
ncbi:MAG TPA: hypothetical protein VMZ52_01840, partial [Bryobacteraceae bacterium]|nr:hypothetical protein [Bryobacteraceae bacterium]